MLICRWVASNALTRRNPLVNHCRLAWIQKDFLRFRYTRIQVEKGIYIFISMSDSAELSGSLSAHTSVGIALRCLSKEKFHRFYERWM